MQVKTGLLVSMLALGVFSAPTNAQTSYDEWQSKKNSTASLFKDGFPEKLVPGRAIVRLQGLDHETLGKIQQSPQLFNTFSSRLDGIANESKSKLRFVRRMQFGWFLVDLFDASSVGNERPSEAKTEFLVRRLNEHKDVESANTDLWHRPQLFPNDEFVGAMWPLASIGAEGAWDLTTGLSSQRIAVIDSGTIRVHEDLSAKDLRGFDFISDSLQANDGSGRDLDYNDSGNGADCGQGFQPDNFHGTHVAGTILASANNNRGIAGLNWNAQLVTARALGRCGGANSDILEAMAWTAGFEVDGVTPLGGDVTDVINMSLGSSSPCDSVSNNYTTTITNNGVAVVAAAGNDGNNVPVGSPASCDGVIAVAAHTSSGQLAPYSNFGNRIDIVAPGGLVQNAANQGVLSGCGPQSDCYTFYQGTSMASPHVAGVVSLMRAVSPNATPAQLKTILLNTATPCVGCGSKNALRMDLAIAEAGGFEPPPPPPAVLGETRCINNTCDPGLQCLGTGEGSPNECFRECQNASGCDADFHCVTVSEDGLNVCVRGGDVSLGGACTDGLECEAGAFCVGGECKARCALGYECPGENQTCDINGICLGDNGPGPGPGPDPGPGEGEGEGEGGECDNARGHWDCEFGFVCEDGTCTRRAGREGLLGDLCDEDRDCDGGLCDRGVCTKPCDYDCDEGYECVDDAIPGGLCRAQSCADSRGDICEDDRYCVYTSAERYVCAREGEDAFAFALCTHERAIRGQIPFSIAALSFLLVFLRRRRL